MPRLIPFSPAFSLKGLVGTRDGRRMLLDPPARPGPSKRAAGEELRLRSSQNGQAEGRCGKQDREIERVRGAPVASPL